MEHIAIGWTCGAATALSIKMYADGRYPMWLTVVNCAMAVAAFFAGLPL